MTDASISPYARSLQAVQPAPVAVALAPAPRPPSMWEQYRQVLAPPVEKPGHLHSAITGLRFNLESAAMGALLGAIHGKLGTLDIAGKYPADGILAFVLYALSVKEAGTPDGFSQDLRALSQACTSVAMFRKTNDWVKPSPPSPDTDPLVAAANRFKL